MNGYKVIRIERDVVLDRFEDGCAYKRPGPTSYTCEPPDGGPLQTFEEGIDIFTIGADGLLYPGETMPKFVNTAEPGTSTTLEDLEIGDFFVWPGEEISSLKIKAVGGRSVTLATGDLWHPYYGSAAHRVTDVEIRGKLGGG